MFCKLFFYLWLEFDSKINNTHILAVAALQSLQDLQRKKPRAKNIKKNKISSSKTDVEATKLKQVNKKLQKVNKVSKPIAKILVNDENLRISTEKCDINSAITNKYGQNSVKKPYEQNIVVNGTIQYTTEKSEVSLI